jgi:hypothetical protein
MLHLPHLVLQAINKLRRMSARGVALLPISRVSNSSNRNNNNNNNKRNLLRMDSRLPS